MGLQTIRFLEKRDKFKISIIHSVIYCVVIFKCTKGMELCCTVYNFFKFMDCVKKWKNLLEFSTWQVTKTVLLLKTKNVHRKKSNKVHEVLSENI